MVDVALIRVRAGDGGNGCVSFRHEKSNFKGGPDGGDGGDGGSVYLVGEGNLRTLDYFAGKQRFAADRGEHGRHKNQEGAKAENLSIKVPQGCVVYDIDGEIESQLSKKQLFEILRDNKLQSEVIHREGENPNNQASSINNQAITKHQASISKQPQLVNDQFRIRLVGEVLERGQEMLVARGGKGGRGNTAFKGPTNTTPREAEEGGRGEEKWLVLELKMLADVGLVGLPNVGKSTLLSVLTNARPKIADYEFTTLEPNLGVLYRSTKSQASITKQAPSTKHQISNNRELVIADIPGLIAGASKGKGLGDEFLRHVERCGLLVHVVAPRLTVGSRLSAVSKQMVEDYQTVRSELGEYYPKLLEKPEVVVVNKLDLIYDSRFKIQVQKEFKERGVEQVLFVSAGTREGIERLEEVLMRSRG